MIIPKGDYVYKLMRARRHLDDLQAIKTEWLSGNHHTTRKHRDPNGPSHRPELLRVFATVEDIPLDPFVLAIGDALHNLRGSLDHLIYRLAERYATQQSKAFTEEMAERTEFPIYGDKRGEGIAAVEKRYGSAFALKIGGIAPLAQADVKGLQPYHRGSDYTTHPLWLLQELSNLDKHRLLLVAQCFCKGTILRSLIPSMYKDIVIKTPMVPLKGETEIACLNLVDQSHDVAMKFDPLIDIVFDCGSNAVQGKPVLEVLADINNFILREVVPKLSVYLS